MVLDPPEEPLDPELEADEPPIAPSSWPIVLWRSIGCAGGPEPPDCPLEVWLAAALVAFADLRLEAVLAAFLEDLAALLFAVADALQPLSVG